MFGAGETNTQEVLDNEEVGTDEESPETSDVEATDGSAEPVDASTPEARIKSFQAQATKASQEAAQFKKELEELRGKARDSEELNRKIQAFQDYTDKLLRDDNYRESMRQQHNIRRPEPNAKPEGWDSLEAVQARNLLIDEFERALQQKYGFDFSALPTAVQQAASVETMLVRDAQAEIDTTKIEIEKEGMPWSEEILQACIAVVKKHTENGQNISLKKAYEKVINPILEKYKAKEASTDAELKGGPKPMKPGDKGGKPKLTGDALLKSVIQDLGVKGQFEDE